MAEAGPCAANSLLRGRCMPGIWWPEVSWPRPELRVPGPAPKPVTEPEAEFAPAPAPEPEPETEVIDAPEQKAQADDDGWMQDYEATEAQQ